MSKREKDQQLNEQAESENWVPKVLFYGAVIGAATGMMGAYLLIQRSRHEGIAPKMNAGEGVRLGVLLFGLLRQIQLLGEGS